MRLVECDENTTHQPSESKNTAFNVRDEEYSTPRTMQNLDKEMETILNDTTTDIDQKWHLYHQALQRYLGFIKRMRHGDYTTSNNTQTHTGLDRDVLSSDVFNSDSKSETVKHATSTPKKNSSKLTATFGLPIRIRKRLMRQAIRSRSCKNNKICSNTTAAIDLDDDDTDDDESYGSVNSGLLASDIEGYDDDNVAMETVTNTPSVVVNGWAPSDIIR